MASMKNMSEISFVSEFLHPTDSGSYYADILVVDSKDGLFEELNSKLAFPYFGFNWDALWDLYCDFHWIDRAEVYIYHHGVTQMPFQELSVYLGIVVDSCEEWKNYPQHNVHFIFNSNEKDLIMDVIKKKQ